MRTRLLSGVLAAAFLGLLCAAANVSAGDTPAPVTQATGGDWPWPGDPRPYEASPQAKNIDLALRYLLLDNDPDRWMNLAVLDYLQRKFGLHARYSIASMYVPADQPWMKVEVAVPFGRLASPFHKHDPGGAAENVKDFVKAMEVGLYSDRFPPPPDFVTRLRGELEEHRGKGGIHDYAVTHHALAFHWMTENNVAWKYEGSKGLRPEFGNALAEIVTRNGPDKDVSYEAMAFLQYMGLRSMVKQEWIGAAAAAQRPDGGWGYKPDTGPSHGHPTVLALWALLENALPDAPAVTWVQRTEEDISSTAGKGAPAETSPADAPAP
jgi:hypothetical protein